MANTKIEWTEKSWNPVTGCTKISSGCQNCYAERMAKRLRGRYGYPANDPFRVTLHPERLEDPLRWRKPSRIFVVSMGDLFHEDVDTKYIAKIFGIIDLCRRHDFLLLTKRPERMKQLLADEDFHFHIGWFQSQAIRELGLSEPKEIGPWPFKNCWLGVTAENQEMADERIPILLQIPAAVRFVSVEPMLGPVDLEKYLRGWDIEIVTRVRARPAHDPRCDGSCRYCPVPVPEQYPEQEMVYAPRLDWVICGGETGPNARPMHPDWARNLRDQCQEAGVPFFFKQWGEWLPQKEWMETETEPDKERRWVRIDGRRMFKVGKKAAGRLLDGREWNEIPEVRNNA